MYVKLNYPWCLMKHHAIHTYGGVEVYLHALLISAVEVGEWLASNPGRFISDVRSLVPWFGVTSMGDQPIASPLPTEDIPIC
jgi:hypothetical protein